MQGMPGNLLLASCKPFNHDAEPPGRSLHTDDTVLKLHLPQQACNSMTGSSCGLHSPHVVALLGMKACFAALLLSALHEAIEQD